MLNCTFRMTRLALLASDRGDMAFCMQLSDRTRKASNETVVRWQLATSQHAELCTTLGCRESLKEHEGTEQSMLSWSWQPCEIRIEPAMPLAPLPLPLASGRICRELIGTEIRLAGTTAVDDFHDKSESAKLPDSMTRIE